MSKEARAPGPYCPRRKPEWRKSYTVQAVRYHRRRVFKAETRLCRSYRYPCDEARLGLEYEREDLRRAWADYRFVQGSRPWGSLVARYVRY